jgi:tetratricopeptide (TPR) repeat protein
MTASFPSDPVVARARALANEGAWAEVLAILEPRASLCAQDGVSALLYAEALMRSGEERKALGWLRDTEPRLDAIGERGAQRRAINMIGAASLALGELDDASAAFGRALDLATQADDFLVLARATNNLGAIENLRGDHEHALWHYRLALPTFQRLGQRRGLAASYHNLAITFRDLGQLEEADEHERKAIDHAVDAGELRLGAMGRIGRAEIALRRGDAVLAETTARMALEQFAELGDAQNEADAHRLIGAACSAQRRYDAALEEIEQSLDIVRAREYALGEAESLRDRVEVWMGLGQVTSALEDARAALAIFERLGATRERDALERRVASIR